MSFYPDIYPVFIPIYYPDILKVRNLKNWNVCDIKDKQLFKHEIFNKQNWGEITVYHMIFTKLISNFQT